MACVRPGSGFSWHWDVSAIFIIVSAPEALLFPFALSLSLRPPPPPPPPLQGPTLEARRPHPPSACLVCPPAPPSSPGPFHSSDRAASHGKFQANRPLPDSLLVDVLMYRPGDAPMGRRDPRPTHHSRRARSCSPSPIRRPYSNIQDSARRSSAREGATCTTSVHGTHQRGPAAALWFWLPVPPSMPEAGLSDTRSPAHSDSCSAKRSSPGSARRTVRVSGIKRVVPLILSPYVPLPFPPSPPPHPAPEDFSSEALRWCSPLDQPVR